MSKFLSKAVVVAAVISSSIALALPLSAAPLLKDDFRARVVDYCLYDKWARARDGETKGILATCRCAAKAFVKDLDKEELSGLLETGALSRDNKKAVLTKYAACE